MKRRRASSSGMRRRRRRRSTRMTPRCRGIATSQAASTSARTRTVHALTCNAGNDARSMPLSTSSTARSVGCNLPNVSRRDGSPGMALPVRSDRRVHRIACGSQGRVELGNPVLVPGTIGVSAISHRAGWPSTSRTVRTGLGGCVACRRTRSPRRDGRVPRVSRPVFAFDPRSRIWARASR